MYPEKGISAVIVKTERGAKLIDEIVDCVAYSNNVVAADDVLLHEDPNKRSGLEERRDAVIAQYEVLGSGIFDSVLVPKVTLFDRVKKMLPPSMRLSVKRLLRSIKSGNVQSRLTTAITICDRPHILGVELQKSQSRQLRHWQRWGLTAISSQRWEIPIRLWSNRGYLR